MKIWLFQQLVLDTLQKFYIHWILKLFMVADLVAWICSPPESASIPGKIALPLLLLFPCSECWVVRGVSPGNPVTPRDMCDDGSGRLASPSPTRSPNIHPLVPDWKHHAWITLINSEISLTFLVVTFLSSLFYFPWSCSSLDCLSPFFPFCLVFLRRMSKLKWTTVVFSFLSLMMLKRATSISKIWAPIFVRN